MVAVAAGSYPLAQTSPWGRSHNPRGPAVGLGRDSAPHARAGSRRQTKPGLDGGCSRWREAFPRGSQQS
ncbi:unnamed protein product [Caretta caretta]